VDFSSVAADDLGMHNVRLAGKNEAAGAAVAAVLADE
jgi:hypothetical protein